MESIRNHKQSPIKKRLFSELQISSIDNDIPNNMKYNLYKETKRDSNKDKINKTVNENKNLINADEKNIFSNLFHSKDFVNSLKLLKMIKDLSGEITQLNSMIITTNEKIKIAENENNKLKEDISYMKLIYSRRVPVQCNCIII